VKIILITAMLVSLSACVSLNVSRVTSLNGNEEICIEENPAVRQAFLDAYVRRIENIGYKTRVIKSGSESNCAVTSTYTANYGIHWGLYLARAQLNIYKNSELIGTAEYRAPFMSPGKHGRIEGKIAKMVSQLFSGS